MSRKTRIVRHFGAIVLLFAWAQVATANAVPCAIWCHLNGGAPAHAPASAHGGHDHGGAPQHDCSPAISGTHCGTPQLLVVAAVTPDILAIPAVTVTAEDPPVAELQSLLSTFTNTDTPPPRA